MKKTMGVSPVTGRIYYGVLKDNAWVGNKEDVTSVAVRAVFEKLMMEYEDKCKDVDAIEVRFKGVPYVLSMRKEVGGVDGD